MPIKSYLAYAATGQLSELDKVLSGIDGCETIPSENTDILILVTDTHGQAEEELLTERLKTVPQLHHLSMVSGYNPELASNA